MYNQSLLFYSLLTDLLLMTRLPILLYCHLSIELSIYLLIFQQTKNEFDFKNTYVRDVRIIDSTLRLKPPKLYLS